MPNSPKLYLYKRCNGFYYIGHFLSGRLRWKSTGKKKKSDALKVLLQFEKLVKEKSNEQSLSKLTTEFLSYAKGNYAKNTLALYKIALEHLLSVTGDCALSFITPKHIDYYKINRLKAVSAVTVNIELESLRAFFNTAIRWKYLDVNPCNCVAFVREPEQVPTFLTKEDFEKLLSLIKEQWLREIVIFAVITGLRRGEIVNLKWSDIDLERKLLNVQSSPNFSTKLGKRRTIPLSEVAFHLLQSRFGKGTSEFVFSLNDQKISEGWLTHKFKYYVYEAKLNNDKLHFHSLRHTFASWLVQDGVSLYEVQKLLGHSNISVTQVYSHLQPETLHSTVNRISIPLN
jgi:site-specific recombinase XerD